MELSRKVGESVTLSGDLLSLTAKDDAVHGKALGGLDCIAVLDVLRLFGGELQARTGVHLDGQAALFVDAFYGCEISLTNALVPLGAGELYPLTFGKLSIFR